MTEEKIRPIRTIKAVIFGLAVLLIVGLAGFLFGRFAQNRQPEPEISAVVLQRRLSSISELASVAYLYTDMGQFENSGEFYGHTIPFTTKKFILTYDGVIKAGVDLRQAEVSVSGGQVRVTLPEAEILSHELDENSVEIFDQRTSIFNPFTVEDFTSFQAAQKAEMEAKALEGGLLKEAKEKAADSVRLLLAPLLPEDAALVVE